MLRRITFSPDDDLIARARRKAREQGTTLTDEFRTWLGDFAARSEAGTNYQALMANLEHARPGRRFSRDELNER